MFKLIPNPTFRATVTIHTPGGDPQPLEFEFRHKAKSQLMQWRSTLAGRPNAEVIPEFIAGWTPPMNEHGEPVPWSVEAFLTLCDHYHAAAAQVFTGYLKALTEAREKN